MRLIKYLMISASSYHKLSFFELIILLLYPLKLFLFIFAFSLPAFKHLSLIFLRIITQSILSEVVDFILVEGSRLFPDEVKLVMAVRYEIKQVLILLNDSALDHF